MNTMKSLGINYKVSKNNNSQKTGILPQVDPEMIEKLLNLLESKMKESPEASQVDEIMNLYQKVLNTNFS